MRCALFIGEVYVQGLVNDLRVTPKAALLGAAAEFA